MRHSETVQVGGGPDEVPAGFYPGSAPVLDPAIDRCVPVGHHRDHRIRLTFVVGPEKRLLDASECSVPTMATGTRGALVIFASHAAPLFGTSSPHRPTRRPSGRTPETPPRAITKGEPPKVTLEDGLMSVAVGVAAHRSIDEERPVLMSELIP